MRHELENIERVVAYLSDTMSAPEKNQFEKDLETNSALRDELSIQKNLMEGVKRQHLRGEVQAAERTFNRIRLTKNILFTTLIFALAATIGMIVYSYYQQNKHINPELEIISETALNENLPTQTFKVDTRKDTILVSSSGIVFAIDEGSFDTHESQVTLHIQEALTPEQIIQAGLSTTSNGELLETGGMFCIQAVAGGILVNLRKPIIAEVPDVTGKPGMQLFDGVADSTGIINWVNPQPTETFLQTYPVTSLDFYPPDYIHQLEFLKQDYSNKSYTDSLYYSFATELTALEDSVESSYNNFIEPAKIRTIWNEKYNQTLVATKEFEARLKIYHEQCEARKLFELVMNNLDKPFREIDKMALAIENTPELESFAKEDKGRVRPDSGLFKSLNAFYEKQWKLLNSQAFAQRQAYLKLQEQDDITFQRKKWATDHTADSVNRALFQKELLFNLDTAYKQLGYTLTALPTIGRITVRLNSTGWKNLDQYVLASTIKRESMQYTDPITGKTAVLKYAMATVIVEGSDTFDQLKVYAIPNKFNSYVRMNNVNKTYQYSLNEMMRYQLFITGMKGDQEFLYQSPTLTSGETKVQLQPVSASEMNAAFASLSKNNDMNVFETEKELMRLTAVHARKRAAFELNEKIRREIARYIFHYCDEISYPIEVKEAYSSDDQTGYRPEVVVYPIKNKK